MTDVERATISAVERGARLKALRNQVGLFQDDVGAVFGINKAAVSEWEHGKSNPDRRKLLKLDELYGGTGEVLRLYEVAPVADNEREVLNRLDELEQLVRQLQRDLKSALDDGLEGLADLMARVDRLEQRGEQAADG